MNKPNMRIFSLCIVAAYLTAAPPAALAATPGTVAARPRMLPTELHAYAQVVPVAELPVRAPVTGIVTDMHLLPGDRVSAGADLGRLAGPDVEAYLAQREAAVRSAQAAAKAARSILDVRRQMRSERLGTRLNVYHAEAEFAQAQATLAQSRAALRAAQAAIRLTAATDAKVRAVLVANGERVSPGQRLITLQPSGRLWLRATFYGKKAASVQPGMSGRFTPADGSPAIAVRVRGVIGRLRSDGGETVGLVATTGAPSWRTGEAGTLTLDGTARPVVMIPTRALILDQGQWWVLVHAGAHEQHRRVVPGAREGESTAIVQGLQPGERVVVSNAYLRFHRGVAGQYQPPD